MDLGNELGVNWRKLVGAMGCLLEEGKIGKMDGIYYPVIRSTGGDYE